MPTHRQDLSLSINNNSQLGDKYINIIHLKLTILGNDKNGNCSI